MLAGRGVMINWSDVAPEHRPAYYEWHSREHMVGRVGIPGVCRGRGGRMKGSGVGAEDRAGYYEWHSREDMGGRVGIPGFCRGRRYIAVHAQRDFLVLYEVDDLSVLTGADYLAKANAPSPLTQRT